MTWTTLVSAIALHAELNAPRLCIFDCRHDLARPAAGAEAYAAGHLPGARFLPLDEVLSGPKTGRNGRHPLPDAALFAAALAHQGVSADTQVVAYDEGSGMFAARLWWLLRWIGHPCVAVLDGGVAAWLAAGHALKTAPPEAAVPGDLRAETLEITADAAELLAALDRPTPLIIDARAPDRFRGENETLDPVGGHIPGARNRFFRDNLATSGLFKSPTQLRSEWLDVLAGTPPADVVAQCGSGVTACHNLLALEVAGLPGARLYPGSWSEWCADPARPVARGD